METVKFIQDSDNKYSCTGCGESVTNADKSWDVVFYNKFCPFCKSDVSEIISLAIEEKAAPLTTKEGHDNSSQNININRDIEDNGQIRLISKKDKIALSLSFWWVCFLGFIVVDSIGRGNTNNMISGSVAAMLPLGVYWNFRILRNNISFDYTRLFPIALLIFSMILIGTAIGTVSDQLDDVSDALRYISSSIDNSTR
ncbi:hypothetical protein D5125_17075 [Magnetovirga frankeli]|uniref:hypothetical protein n=1 Tax=Magnetovirga frankeli TaxID=947516 RepID=UPI001292E575|nr:hypothetical protein D5125_17075 [gamma proteobacterium SS-5]